MVTKQKKTNEYLLKNNSVDINELHSFNIKIPKNKGLTIFADFKLYKHRISTDFIGYNSINLYKVLPKLLEDEDEEAQKMKKEE